MAIPLRPDFDAAAVRLEDKRSKDGAQARRLLALAAIYDFASRTEAAAIGSVTVQIVRDWLVKFNEHGPAGLIDRKPPDQPSRLTAAHRTALVQAIEDGIPSIHGVVRWRLIDNLVRRPGPHRPEEQDYPAIGSAGLASCGTS